MIRRKLDFSKAGSLSSLVFEYRINSEKMHLYNSFKIQICHLEPHRLFSLKGSLFKFPVGNFRIRMNITNAFYNCDK